jgi:Transposase and inactivated derivatives
MQTPIITQREIVRLLEQRQLSNRAIARQLSLSHNTVAIIRARLQVTGLSHSQLLTQTDEAFALALGTGRKQPKTEKLTPEWHVLQTELQKRDITLALLWEEYRLANQNQLERCLSYSQFARHFRQWLKRQRISMRQFHKPGDKVFVDFCGRTISILDPDTGESYPAQVFVGVLGGSGLTFAYAVPSQKTHDWIECHIKMFDFFGGIPQQVVPDNLKSAIIKHSREEVITNAAYADWAEHYDVLIAPARSRKPKDKSLAEVGVQIVQRWVLAPLRKQQFFSIDELNNQITPRLHQLNDKVSKTYQKSRKQRFIEIDQPALRPLPLLRYECVDWRYRIRVPDDYHLEYAGNYYSVPYQYRSHLVDLRVTRTTLEVLLHRQRIASHQLCSSSGRSTLMDHMPLEHQRQSDQSPETLLEWAQSVGPNVATWVRHNLQQRRDFANGLKSVRNLRRWIREEQNHERIDPACEFAMKLGAFSFSRLKSIINNRSDQRAMAESTAWVQQHSNLRGPEYYKPAGVLPHAE